MTTAASFRSTLTPCLEHPPPTGATVHLPPLPNTPTPPPRPVLARVHLRTRKSRARLLLFSPKEDFPVDARSLARRRARICRSATEGRSAGAPHPGRPGEGRAGGRAPGGLRPLPAAGRGRRGAGAARARRKFMDSARGLVACRLSIKRGLQS